MTSPEPCENCGATVAVHDLLGELGPDWYGTPRTMRDDDYRTWQVSSPHGEWFGTARVALVQPNPRLYELESHQLTTTHGPIETVMYREHTPDRCRSARTRRQGASHE